MTTLLGIFIAPDRDVVGVVVTGELDIASGPALDTTLRELREAGFDRLRLDLRDLDFLDGAGVTQLLRWRQLSRLEGFELAIALPTGAARRAIDLAGLATTL